MAQERNKKKVENNEIEKSQQLEVLRICASSFLETRDFPNADKYYMEILDLDPEDFDAYFNLVMIDSKTNSIEELFDYYSSQNIDPATKISSKINSLYATRNKFKSADNNESQHFSFTTYRTIQNLYDEYLGNRDKKYQEYIEQYNEAKDVEELEDLIIKFEELKDYKDASRYVLRCKNKIDKFYLDNKSNERKEKINNILTIANDFLQSGEYKLADEYYSEALQLDPENIDAYLGILMIDTKTNNKDELFEYYQNLYIDDETEILEACKKDVNHINDMIDKYAIPGYLDADTIREYYEFDSEYVSVLNSRKDQRKKIAREFELNPILSKISQINRVSYRELFDKVLAPYNQRVYQAEKEDEAIIETLTKQYSEQVKEADRKVVDKYKANPEKAKKAIKDTISFIQNKKPKKESKKKSETGLDNAYRLLNNGNYNGARDVLKTIVSNNPDNADAYLGLLMVETKTKNIDDLFAYYENLYNYNDKQKITAIQENRSHIDKMVDDYHSRKISKKAIADKYKYDRTFDSLTDAKIRGKEALMNAISTNKNFYNIVRIGDEELIGEIQKLVDVYDRRIAQAKEDDKAMVEIIRSDYNNFLRNTDDEVIALSKGVAVDKKKTDKVKSSKTVITRPKKEKIRKEIRSIDKGKIAKAALGLLAAGAVIVGLYFGGNYYYQNIMVPENRYKEAIQLAENGDYEAAIAAFEELGDYKDCKQRIDDALYDLAMKKEKEADYIGAINILTGLKRDGIQDEINRIKSLYNSKIEIGATILYGLYEQDNNSSNGREILEWQVVSIEEDRVLLLCKNVISVDKFDTTYDQGVNWSNSTIRFWLNGKFPDNAFDKEDPTKILSTDIVSIARGEGGELEEIETNDYIFLLSQEEVESLFSDPTERIATASMKVVAENTALSGNNRCGWWLRDLGEEIDTAKYIWAENGEVAVSVTEINQGIRPAMWFSINPEATADTQDSGLDEGF